MSSLSIIDVSHAWHDTVCPEAEDCRDRHLHALAMPLATSGVLHQFMARLNGPVHLPQRGSEVEAWLRRWRDRCTEWGDRQGFLLLDELLEDYRLRADTGLTLDQDTEEAS